MPENADRTSTGSRLLTVITRLRQTDQSATIARGWATAVGVDPGDLGESLQAIADVIRLIHQVKYDVKLVPNIKHDLYIRQLERLQQAIATSNPNGTLSGLLGNIDPVLVQGLEFCADQLDNASQEVTVNQEEIDSLLATLRLALEDVLTANIDTAFKAVLIVKLRDLERAVLSYRLFGIGPLRSAVDGAIGALVVEQTAARAPEHKRSVKEFLDLLVQAQSAVRGALSMVTALPQAIDSVKGFLGSGG